MNKGLRSCIAVMLALCLTAGEVCLPGGAAKAMKVQHNVASMNTYRNYVNNTDTINKNLEKLSSGYMINRAGDDARGLAISEKIRVQIQGLEAAQKSAKDEMGKAQTAEGALTEVHSMLDRMSYLVEQSAGTAQDGNAENSATADNSNWLREQIELMKEQNPVNGNNANLSAKALKEKLSSSLPQTAAADTGIGLAGTDLTMKDILTEASDARNQNRLERAINNLRVMEEAQRNALSQSGGTDLTGEMTNFTRNNIMNQSAQAMLSGGYQNNSALMSMLGGGSGAYVASTSRTVPEQQADTKAADTAADDKKGQTADAKAEGADGASSMAAKSIDDYKDKESVTYGEAGQVLTNIGVMEGYADDHPFNSLDTLNMGKACEIIARLLRADVNAIAPSSWDDVQSDWAFQFCESIGIISGYGDGQINPDDPVSGAGFAKMLLVALGYDAEVENLSESEWSQYITQLDKPNIKAETSFETSSVSRDEAAQHAFDAIKTLLVNYDGGSSDQTISLEDAAQIIIAAVTATADSADEANDLLKNVFGEDFSLPSESESNPPAAPGTAGGEDGETVGAVKPLKLQDMSALNINMNSLQQSLSLISSGKRTDSAADDASADAISEKVRVQLLDVNVGQAKGAVEAREAAASKPLTVERGNTRSAEERTSDIDTATEMLQFTKNSIMVQAAQGMLATSNQAPMSVLQLLGGETADSGKTDTAADGQGETGRAETVQTDADGKTADAKVEGWETETAQTAAETAGSAAGDIPDAKAGVYDTAETAGSANSNTAEAKAGDNETTVTADGTVTADTASVVEDGKQGGTAGKETKAEDKSHEETQTSDAASSDTSSGSSKTPSVHTFKDIKNQQAGDTGNENPDELFVDDESSQKTEKTSTDGTAETSEQDDGTAKSTDEDGKQGETTGILADSAADVVETVGSQAKTDKNEAELSAAQTKAAENVLKETDDEGIFRLLERFGFTTNSYKYKQIIKYYINGVPGILSAISTIMNYDYPTKKTEDLTAGAVTGVLTGGDNSETPGNEVSGGEGEAGGNDQPVINDTVTVGGVVGALSGIGNVTNLYNVGGVVGALSDVGAASSNSWVVPAGIVTGAAILIGGAWAIIDYQQPSKTIGRNEPEQNMPNGGKMPSPVRSDSGQPVNEKSDQSDGQGANSKGSDCEVKGHVAGEPGYENVVARTCTAGGGYDLVTRCKVCGDILESRHVTLEAMGHRREPIGGYPATCEADGLTGGLWCPDCETVFENRQTIPATGHTWGAWQVTRAATTIRDGLEIRVCQNDASHKEERAIPKLVGRPKRAETVEVHVHSAGRTVRTDITEATCKAGGSYRLDVYCAGCPELISSETFSTEKNPQNHTGGTEILNAVTATCKTEGYTGDTYCLGCGAMIEKGKSTGKNPSNHEGNTEIRGAVTATCKTEGYSGDTYCLGCGAMIGKGKSTGLNASNHEGDTEIRGTVTATCKTEGYTGDTYCLGCGVMIEKGKSTGLNASNHEGDTEIRGAVTATCKTDGYTGNTCCAGCDAILQYGTNFGKDATNHEGDRNVIYYVETNDGYAYYVTCGGCGEIIETGITPFDDMTVIPEFGPPPVVEEPEGGLVG